MFGSKKAEVANLQEQLAVLSREREAMRVQLASSGLLTKLEIEEQVAALQGKQAELRSSIDRRTADLKSVEERIVQTEESAILQEVGVYEYRHPLSDAVAYRDQLERLKREIKFMARKDGGAILASTTWQVDGSAAKGRKLVGDISKLMLRAYNAEADNLVRSMKPYKLQTSLDRLGKVVSTIERLGRSMNIRISQRYHEVRVKEFELTADYLEMLAREKEQEREERARLREERRVQQEIQRERDKLEKERQHYLNALAALEAKGDSEAAERVRGQLGDVESAIKDVDYRAANVRAGYVYVISNLGSFGERIVKIGMTRRLEPRDRVRELSDASVPFNFDTHALFFSDDAVGIEAEMHRRLADRRVNQVNLRREFFYVTPAEVRDELASLAGEMLEFSEIPEAVEYHQSQLEGVRASDPHEPPGDGFEADLPPELAPL